MGSSSEVKLDNMKNLVSTENLAQPENEHKSNLTLPCNNKNNSNLKSTTMKKPKDLEKIKCSGGNRPTYQRRCLKPPGIKRKSAPVYVHMSNPSAEVILRERKVEIKDLESQVVYLQNQIKELRIENRTLHDLQNRQEKELKKFKGGVADIPSLLRSHKDEIKAIESNATSLRRELKDCQRDLKVKSDLILKKDQQLDKLNVSLKRNDKHLQEVISENKELKLDNKKIEEESKKLSGGNEELKSKNDRLQKKIQQMTSTILNLEEKLGTADHFKGQLRDDLYKLQKKYDELLQSEAALKKDLHISHVTMSTQTEHTETSSISCMTEDSIYAAGKFQKGTSIEDFEDIKYAFDMNQGDKIENIYCSVRSNDASTDFPFKFSSSNSSNIIPESRTQKKPLLKPMNDISSIPMKMFEKRHSFAYDKNDEGKANLFLSNDSKLQTDNSINKEHLKKTHYSVGKMTHNKHTENEQDSIVYSSLCNTNENQRHSRTFSNLTIKQNHNKSDWMTS